MKPPEILVKLNLINNCRKINVLSYRLFFFCGYYIMNTKVKK